jgi:rubrerythrin
VLRNGSSTLERRNAMAAKESTREEVRRLLALFRKGLIAEDDLLEQLEEIRATGAEASAGDDAPSRVAALLGVLDGYRAAEASGAATLRKWSDLSADAGLAGGLRTIAAREAFHAELLDRRIRELGGEPHARVPAWLADYNEVITDPRATDDDRLEAIVAQFPDIDAALAPLERTIESLAGDPLTRELLRTIGQDEKASLEWFHSTYATRSTRE